MTETSAGNTQSATTWFVWDGDALLQEIQPGKTITYLYEPESFVPLARVESAEGQAAYAPGQTHLPHVTDWDLPGNRACVEAHVQTRRAHVEAQEEEAHQARWRETVEKAKSSATQDRLHYYHCDHLGTPLELLDDAGKPVWAARYRAWGQVLSYDVQEVEQPLRFQGQYLDEETGFITTEIGITIRRREGLLLRIRLGWRVALITFSMLLLRSGGLIRGAWLAFLKTQD